MSSTYLKFYEAAQRIARPWVLELGTLQSEKGRSTMHRHFVPHAAVYDGSDITEGPDVDVVADVHKLSLAVGRYDIIISCSSFEHFKYPHLAAHEIMKTLRVGGLLFIQTHQTFPLHADPYDYFRFSAEALAGLFGTQNGFEVVSTGYEFPVTLQRDNKPYGAGSSSYLNSLLFGRKVAPTPENYVYELDTRL